MCVHDTKTQLALHGVLTTIACRAFMIAFVALRDSHASRVIALFLDRRTQTEFDRRRPPPPLFLLAQPASKPSLLMSRPFHFLFLCAARPAGPREPPMTSAGWLDAKNLSVEVHVSRMQVPNFWIKAASVPRCSFPRVSCISKALFVRGPNLEREREAWQTEILSDRAILSVSNGCATKREAPLIHFFYRWEKAPKGGGRSTIF